MSPVVLFSIGNPGPITRHSAGHFMLEELIQNCQAPPLVKGKGKYSITSSNDLIFVRSHAYMNESAKAFKQFVDSEKTGADSTILILYDDFEKNVGKIRLGNFKPKESHNGIKGLGQYLSSSKFANYYKLGIGIGPKPSNASKNQMGSWVLSAFKPQEKHILANTSSELLAMYVAEIIEAAGEVDDCNKFNDHMTKVFESHS